MPERLTVRFMLVTLSITGRESVPKKLYSNIIKVIGYIKRKFKG